jgi:hypothetical protein
VGGGEGGGGYSGKVKWRKISSSMVGAAVTLGVNIVRHRVLHDEVLVPDQPRKV